MQKKKKRKYDFKQSNKLKFTLSKKKKKNRLDEEEDRTLKWKGSAPSDMGNNYDKNLTIQEYANRGIHINLL